MSDPSDPDQPAEAEVESDESDAADTGSDKVIDVIDPEGDPENNDLNVYLWGRFWGQGSDPVVAYWEFNPSAVAAEDEADEEDNTPSDRPLIEDSKVAILSGESVLTDYDPSVGREEYFRRLLNYSVEDIPTPEVALQEYRDLMNNYLNDTRLRWLDEFTRDHDEGELENWIEGLLADFYREVLYHYDFCVQLAPPNYDRVETDPADSSADEDHGESEDDPDAPEEAPDPAEVPPEKIENGTQVDVALMNNPSEGVRTPDLTVGGEIYFRIVGSGVDHLPENLVDKERSNPSSIPMVGPIVHIDDDPDLSDQEDADSENYREIIIEIEPEIYGSGLAFKDDRIKIPVVGEDDDPENVRDLIFLGIIMGLIILILVLILTL